MAYINKNIYNNFFIYKIEIEFQFEWISFN